MHTIDKIHWSFPYLVLSLTATWVGQAANGRPKQLSGTKQGKRQFSKLWQEGSMYLINSVPPSINNTDAFM